jgi:acetyl-CoA C-acetyltransferase
MSEIDTRTPVLIGAGQFTWRGNAALSPTPLEMIETAAERAAAGAGLAKASLAGLDALAVIGFTVDAGGGLAKLPFPRLSNPPASLAKRLGADPHWSVYTHMGGNSPQQVINTLAERIARGETDFGLAVGAEFLGALMKRLRTGASFDGYGDPPDDGDLGPPERIGDGRPGVTPEETAHGLNFPVNTYPLFENALRARDGRSIEAHQRRLGELFAPFTKVAAKNPEAWFPVERTPEELVTVTDQNRMISFPYPKYLNAIMEVDQAGGVLIASVAKARELGVPEDRWVYLHGCADAHDLWYPLERQDFHSSPAMRLTGRRALEMAQLTVDKIDLFDLYSCFPVAVEVGAESLGLSLDDPRGFTVTGGLPYAGGPGNNYAMHSLAVMMQRLRERPGRFGMVTANGWFLTKQSVGIYSTTPPGRPVERQDPHVIQREIDALPHPKIVDRPEGRAVIETYTVSHDRSGYRLGIVIGRDDEDRRFVANTPNDPATLADLESREGVGRTGTVRRSGDGRLNIFTPDR